MVTSDEESLFQLLIEEQELLTRYAVEHPRVQSVRKRIEMTRQRSQEAAKSAAAGAADGPPKEFFQVYLDSLRELAKVNEQTLREVDALFADEKKAANDLAEWEARDQTFRADIERKTSLYNTIIKRLDEISLVKEIGKVKLELVHPPQLGKQVSPDFAKSLGIGSILGALAGFGLAFLVDRADRRFRSPDEIRSDLGMPVVGHIPVIPEDRNERSTTGELPTGLSPVLRTYHHPRGRIAEAYRAVRTALYFSSRGSGHQVIQITSPTPGDGKTTLACNLAVSMAQSGKRVLLVDADFRRPRVHRVFGLSNTQGVTSMLDGSAEFSDVVRDSGIDNLSILTCGERPKNPSELLTAEKFEELLGAFREKFDFVIVDTPPVLAVTDPLNVVTRADGVILVMRLSKSARAASHRALEALEEVGANMLGVVVNGVGGRGTYGDYGKYGGYSGYSGYGGYGYGYGYGSYEYRYGYGDGDKSYYEDADEDARNARGHRKVTSQNGKQPIDIERK